MAGAGAGGFGDRRKDRPFLDVYPAGKAGNGCAVVVCPGGRIWRSGS